MSLRDGWPAVSNAADQFDIRAALRVDTALDQDGSIKTGVAVTGKSLSGLVTARSDMQVDVAAFAATLDRQGPVKLYNDGVVQVKLDAAPTANSRIDAIYVKQMETASPISDSADGPVFGKVTGTPSTSPTAPTIPVGAMRLADVTIPSTATSTSSGGVTITQRYPYTASAGGFLRFRTSDEMAAWSAPDGYRAILADGSEYNRSGGAWVSQTHAYWRGKARRSDNQLIVNNGTTDLVITPVRDGGAGVQLSNVVGGTMLSGLLGDWHVSFHLQVAGGVAWSSVGIVLRGGALALLGEGAELSKADGYASLDLHAIIRFTSLADGILFSLNSNTALTMRSDATIGMVRL